MLNIEPERTNYAAIVHVAVAVIKDDQGKILVARRPKEKHMGGFWEFPGGKVEANESVKDALKREIKEEVNLSVGSLTPLIRIPWQYPGKQVLLDVFCCSVEKGEAKGCEGQEIKWLDIEELTQHAFPPANKGILNALRLPDKLLITGAADTEQTFLLKLDHAIDQGIRLVQLRDLSFLDSTEADVSGLIERLQQRYTYLEPAPTFLFNAAPNVARKCQSKHLHLKSQYLNQCENSIELRTELENFSLVSASVHSEDELEIANKLGLDFILVAPVQATQSHPQVKPLGWDALENLIQKASMPVYALGGLQETDLPKARSLGAQGIAAISAFWLEPGST